MNKLRQEIVGLLLMALGLLVLLSLVSYHPAEEPTISPNVAIHNWVGIVGVIIAHFLIKGFIGVMAYVIPLLLVLWGWWLFTNREFRILARFTLYVSFLAILFAVVLGLPAVIHRLTPSIGWQYSGLVGGIFAKWLSDLLGLAGTGILLAVLILITIQGYFTLSFYNPLQRLFSRSRRKPKKIYPVAKPPAEELLKPTEPISEPQQPPAPKAVEAAVTVTPAAKSISSATYHLPPLDLLEPPQETRDLVSKEEISENAQKLENALQTFGVPGKVVQVSPGPIITRYEIEPASGVRVGRIAALADDLARILQAQRIRIVAPIPGKATVGVEIPNRKPAIVQIRSILSSKQFTSAKSKLTIALGKNTAGEIYTLDLARLPHLLIAGATGSGKSVCINTIIVSMLYQARPDEIKFVLIDPKKLELSLYKALEGYHLMTCADLDEYVITKPDNAIVALRSVELEMERRYEILANATVRNIDEYNQRVLTSESDNKPLPYIVVIIDELADLMMTSAKEVEEPITRLAQMARAVGIHLIIATQRPSVDVITGVIKANFPARIAFQVASKVDSRTILDLNGAEKLLGRGDMLITTPQNPEPYRVHSSYISLEELERVLDYIQSQPKPGEVALPSVKEEGGEEVENFANGERDPLFYEALKLVVMHQQGSISLLQRRLKIGYSRAARLIDQLEQAGIVGPFTGSKAREVLVDEDYLENLSDDKDLPVN